MTTINPTFTTTPSSPLFHPANWIPNLPTGPQVVGYPPEWPAAAMLVKLMAGLRCENCGRTGQASNVLGVHHLDRQKWNLQGWNLICVCQVCHLYLEANVFIDCAQGELFPEHGISWLPERRALRAAWLAAQTRAPLVEAEAQRVGWVRASPGRGSATARTGTRTVRICRCGCGEPVGRARTGRPREFVHASHRQAAYRRRRGGQLCMWS